MKPIFRGRHAALVRDDCVVFLIGVRLNRWWAVLRWLRIVVKVWPMLWSEKKRRDGGLLHFQPIYLFGNGLGFIQYWKDAESLIAFARKPEGRHFEFWKWFNAKIADNGSIGIWHETYMVKAEQIEAVYGNMPEFGLARASRLVPLELLGESASKRLGLTDTDDVPIPGY